MQPKHPDQLRSDFLLLHPPPQSNGMRMMHVIIFFQLVAAVYHVFHSDSERTVFDDVPDLILRLGRDLDVSLTPPRTQLPSVGLHVSQDWVTVPLFVVQQIGLVIFSFASERSANKVELHPTFLFLAT